MRRILPLVLAVLALVSGGPSAPGLVDAERAADAPRPVAVFFGDSYFVGGGCSPDADRDMASLAGSALGYRTVVRGGGGTGFVVANDDYGIPPYLQQIQAGALDADDVALVVIEGGSNDVGQSVRAVRRNAGKVITAARTEHPGVLLVLAGPMQTYGPLSETTPINRALRRVADRRAVPYVDMQRWTRGHEQWLCSDYDHPTYAGHTALGQQLADALRRRGA